jgi:hypothetical protein
MPGIWHSDASLARDGRPAERAMKASFLWLVLPVLLGGCIYSPRLVDCKVHCAEDKSCPSGMTCDNNFCRPDDAEGFCACAPGEERACGGGQGECLPGVQRCGDSKQWGVCLGEVKATAEVCDGKDNNCNGAIDDDPSDAPPCGRTAGVCAGKLQQCIGGAYPGFCEDAQYGPDFQAIETKCDMKDNDCDGFIDGKAPVHLVDNSSSYVFLGLDGGYGLAWVEEVTTTSMNIKARMFDAALRPLSSAVTLGTTDGGVVMRGAAMGNRAFFLWEDSYTYDIDGRVMDIDRPTTFSRLSNMPRPEARGSPKYGANAEGLLSAYPRDGGLGFAQWLNDGGFNAWLYVPGDAGFFETTYTNVSSRASTVSYTITYSTDPDAGTTTTEDVIMQPDGGRYAIGKYVWSGANFMDLRSGKLAEEYFDYCNYNFFFVSCVKSYISANFDVYNTSLVDLRVLSDPTAITDSHAATTEVDWVMAWTEGTKLYIGTPLTTARTIRFKQVEIDGGVATRVKIANAGGAFNAMVYNSNLGVGALEGVLTCSP